MRLDLNVAKSLLVLLVLVLHFAVPAQAASDTQRIQLALSDRQIAQLRRLTDNVSKDYYRGYGYVSSIIAASAQVDWQTKRWFAGAARINRPDSDDTRRDMIHLYVRNIVRNAALWQGRPVPDIQSMSDELAKQVIGRIIFYRGVPQFRELLLADIGGTLRRFGQSLGAWAGVVYYWDFQLEPGTSIGAMVMADPAQLERFLAINAAAASLIEGLVSEGGSQLRGDLAAEALRWWAESRAPPAIKLELARRIASGRLHGDPDVIDSWIHDRGAKAWRHALLPNIRAKGALAARLDARRRIRQSHAGIKLVHSFAAR